MLVGGASLLAPKDRHGDGWGWGHTDTLLLLDGEAERRERRERRSNVAAEGVEEVVCAHEM